MVADIWMNFPMITVRTSHNRKYGFRIIPAYKYLINNEKFLTIECKEINRNFITVAGIKL